MKRCVLSSFYNAETIDVGGIPVIQVEQTPNEYQFSFDGKLYEIKFTGHHGRFFDNYLVYVIDESEYPLEFVGRFTSPDIESVVKEIIESQ